MSENVNGWTAIGAELKHRPDLINGGFTTGILSPDALSDFADGRRLITEAELEQLLVILRPENLVIYRLMDELYSARMRTKRGVEELDQLVRVAARALRRHNQEIPVGNIRQLRRYRPDTEPLDSFLRRVAKEHYPYSGSMVHGTCALRIDAEDDAVDIELPSGSLLILNGMESPALGELALAQNDSGFLTLGEFRLDNRFRKVRWLHPVLGIKYNLQH